jgi:small GTP-binding protein
MPTKPPFYQITILGDGGSGKTAIETRVYVLRLIISHQQLTSPKFMFHHFGTIYDPIGECDNRKTVEVDEVEIHIETLAPPGEVYQRYAALSEQWIRDASGVLLVYSITSRASFDHIANHLELVRKVKGPHVAENPFPIALVGNKCDLGDGQERQVERSEGEKLAKAAELTCEFKEVSAKTGEGVEEAFFDIIRILQKPYVERSEDKKSETAKDSVKTKKGFKEGFYNIVKKVQRKS